jgi:hypothetical protein
VALRSELLKDIDWRIKPSGVSTGIVSADIGSFVSEVMGSHENHRESAKLHNG